MVTVMEGKCRKSESGYLWRYWNQRQTLSRSHEVRAGFSLSQFALFLPEMHPYWSNSCC
jgi:hypothetical protein